MLNKWFRLIIISFLLIGLSAFSDEENCEGGFSTKELPLHLAVTPIEYFIPFAKPEALKRMGIFLVGDLVATTKEELSIIFLEVTGGSGSEVIQKIEEKLAKHDLRLGMYKDWPPKGSQIQNLTPLLPILTRSFRIPGHYEERIPSPYQKILIEANILYIGDLVSKTRHELRRIFRAARRPSVGEGGRIGNVISSIERFLAENDLQLNMNIYWPKER